MYFVHRKCLHTHTHLQYSTHISHTPTEMQLSGAADENFVLVSGTSALDIISLYQNVCNSSTDIYTASQKNKMPLRCGGIRNDLFVAYFLPSVTAKEF